MCLPSSGTPCTYDICAYIAYINLRSPRVGLGGGQIIRKPHARMDRRPRTPYMLAGVYSAYSQIKAFCGVDRDVHLYNVIYVHLSKRAVL